MYYAPIYKKLGTRIEELRCNTKLNQQQFAYKVGISPANYWEIVNGRRNITIKTAAKIAEALEVDIVELFKP